MHYEVRSGILQPLGDRGFAGIILKILRDHTERTENKQLFLLLYQLQTYIECTGIVGNDSSVSKIQPAYTKCCPKSVPDYWILDTNFTFLIQNSKHLVNVNILHGPFSNVWPQSVWKVLNSTIFWVVSTNIAVVWIHIFQKRQQRPSPHWYIQYDTASFKICLSLPLGTHPRTLSSAHYLCNLFNWLLSKMYTIP